MIAPPKIGSMTEFRSLLHDTDFWWPYVAEVLERHGFRSSGREIVAGVGGTYPTFLYGDVVVKLFGYVDAWRESDLAERAALANVATDPEIRAPRQLGEGQLYDHGDGAWRYRITSRASGVTWRNAELSAEQRLTVAHDLGSQIQRVHMLAPAKAATHEDWLTLDVVNAAKQSSLPPHLITQIDDYLARLGPFDRVFVHGDVMYRHVFIDQGRLSGVIDWGDAMVTDRHYEFAKLHLDLFDCDKALLRAFIEGSGWPVADDFAHRAMAMALYRQAHGLAQHYTMDVFYMLPALLPLNEIATLEELAGILFGIDVEVDD